MAFAATLLPGTSSPPLNFLARRAALSTSTLARALSSRSSGSRGKAYGQHRERRPESFGNKQRFTNDDRGLTRDIVRPNKRLNPRLRTHAISIVHGDYQDDDGDGDIEEEPSFPIDDGDHVNDAEASDAYAAQEAYDTAKARWLENAKPKVRIRELDANGRAYGRGSRKEASARVWVEPGTGILTVNKMDFLDYFPRESHRESILGPFVATETCGKFDVRALVEGGGKSGQAGAVRHGLARALEKYNPDYRPPMKRLGYLTRDPRMVERKKVGKVKARKSPQWVRR